MGSEDAGKFHHIDGIGVAKEFGELVVRDDKSFIFGILKLLGFDVIPYFFDDLRSRELFFSNNGLQLL